MDATNMTIFVNGVQKAQTAKATISATTTAPFKIGLMDNDGGSNKQYFNGLIDEVTVGDTNRSADWIKLCYQNQQANQTLVDLDDYGKWAYSKRIYINTATMGLNSFVTKFPLLVRLNASMINFNEPQSNGADIRFSKADGTHFYYEKEQWDQTNQKASIWVLVDTVFQNNGSQYIKMYWGNASAVDKSNSNAVFDTANGFVGVWHFTPESGTDTLRDATVNGLTLTNASSTPITTPPIALGRTFNGSSQRCYANDAAPLKQTGNLTLSAWINPAALPSAGRLCHGPGVQGHGGVPVYRFNGCGRQQLPVHDRGRHAVREQRGHGVRRVNMVPRGGHPRRGARQLVVLYKRGEAGHHQHVGNRRSGIGNKYPERRRRPVEQLVQRQHG